MFNILRKEKQGGGKLMFNILRTAKQGGGNYLFSTAHRVVENICPYGLSNTKPVERVL